MSPCSGRNLCIDRTTITVSDYAPTPGDGTTTETEQEAKRPRMYRVLIHNDDYTTMDFVVAVLRTVFGKPPAEAVRIMMHVHRSGVGMCGVYTAQVAETKVEAVHALAHDEGFPLRCSMEPE